MIYNFIKINLQNLKKFQLNDAFGFFAEPLAMCKIFFTLIFLVSTHYETISFGQQDIFQRYDLLSKIASHPLTARFSIRSKRFDGTSSAFVDPASIAAILESIREARRKKENYIRDVVGKALKSNMTDSDEENFWNLLKSEKTQDSRIYDEEAYWQKRLENGGFTEDTSILPQVRQILYDSAPKMSATATYPIFLNLFPPFNTPKPPEPELWSTNPYWWFLITGNSLWLETYASQATSLNPLFPILREPILFPRPKD